MEEFNRAIEFLKEQNLSEQDWKFLAQVLQSFIWSADCHTHLKEAVEQLKEDIEPYQQISGG